MQKCMSACWGRRVKHVTTSNRPRGLQHRRDEIKTDDISRDCDRAPFLKLCKCFTIVKPKLYDSWSTFMRLTSVRRKHSFNHFLTASKIC